MASYLVESPHSGEECLKALDNVQAMGYLTHFWWGCPAGEHAGYVILDAENKSEALMAVPPFIRHKARVIELTRFNEEQVKGMHEKRKG